LYVITWISLGDSSQGHVGEEKNDIIGMVGKIKKNIIYPISFLLSVSGFEPLFTVSGIPLVANVVGETGAMWDRG